MRDHIFSYILHSMHLLNINFILVGRIGLLLYFQYSSKLFQIIILIILIVYIYAMRDILFIFLFEE